MFSRGRAGERLIGHGDIGTEFVSGDLTTGEGIDAAVAGVETVVHVAGSAKGDEDKARHLVQALAQEGDCPASGVHLGRRRDRIPVASGIDRAMFGYFAAKLAAERVVAESGIPWSTLRATQFHDLTLATVKGLARMPLIPVPSGFRFQPVEAGEVAVRLVDLALGTPSGLVPAIGGPKVYEMAELVRGYLRATGKHRPIISLWLPGRAARALREGANLAPDRAVGSRTWEDFLAERVSAPSASQAAAT